MMNEQYLNYVKIRHWRKLIVASFKNSLCLPWKITLCLHFDLEATLTAHKNSLQELSNSRIIMDLLAWTVYYYTSDGVLYVLTFSFMTFHCSVYKYQIRIMFLIWTSKSVFQGLYLLPCFIYIWETIFLHHCHFLDSNTVVSYILQKSAASICRERRRHQILLT
jgi:hypothetical protein